MAAVSPFCVAFVAEAVVASPDQVLLIVEIHGERAGRSLHNFAAHLLRVSGGSVSEWRMVDAKPAESDEFWS
jgi:hypothetical protein